MESDAICYLSLQDLSAQLRAGKLSSLEVTRCILVACNSDIGIALMYHEACVRESFA